MSNPNSNDNGRVNPSQIIVWTILGAALGVIVTSTYWVFNSISDLREKVGIVETLTLRNTNDIRDIFEDRRER